MTLYNINVYSILYIDIHNSFMERSYLLVLKYFCPTSRNGINCVMHA